MVRYQISGRLLREDVSQNRPDTLVPEGMELRLTTPAPYGSGILLSGTMNDKLTISMSNDMAALTRLMGRANRFFEDHGLPTRLVYAANLALEEILTNVLKYAYPDEAEHEISVKIELSSQELVILFSDDGSEFNPVTCPEPHVKESILDCQPGGLGIHLVRQTVDSLDYRREGQRNLVTIKIRCRGE
jgi:serine/threonine-protein kinase RsbW